MQELHRCQKLGNVAEYRCDLRDVDPSKVNEAARDYAETHPHRHQKVNLTNHNIGKAVVDFNTMSDPAEADIITVIASQAKGDCYVAAGHYIMENGRDGRTILVQGEVTGQGPLLGVKFGHSWIEKGGMVLEVANGKNSWFPTDLYYSLGQITRTKKYGFKEAMKWMLKTGNFGPWELKTRN